MIKVGGKYVHLGTAWSTDQGRKGSYNLYYCVADKITGPYGPRKFAGRFLGHGTPFQDKDGKWWCTAFFNANVPPLPREGIETRDLGDNAQTINEQGVTIVPLDVRSARQRRDLHSSQRPGLRQSRTGRGPESGIGAESENEHAKSIDEVARSYQRHADSCCRDGPCCRDDCADG